MPPAQTILLTLAGLGALHVGIQIVLPHLWKKGQIRKLHDEVRGKLILTSDDASWDGWTP